MLRRSILAATALVLAAPASAMQSAAPLEPEAPQTAPASSSPTPSMPPSSPAPNPPHDPAPPGSHLAALFPPAARAKKLGGVAKMKCGVTVDGRLSDCVIVFECPAGLGFGDATLKVAPYFKMRPQTKDGRPVAWGTVIIPLKWQVADGNPPPAECVSKR